jgi:MFS family permease
MNSALKVLLACAALSTLATEMFVPIYAIFVGQIGGGLLVAAEAYGAFSIVAGILIFFISRWENSVKHQENLVVLGYAVGSLGFFGLLLVKEPLHLLIVQILFGVSTAITSPAYDALYSRFLDRGKFVLEWGLWESTYYIFAGLAAFSGGLIAALFGFRGLFAVMLALSLAATAVSLYLKGEGRAPRAA